MRHAEDLTGKKFGRLVVIKRFGENKHGHIRWKCTCACGSTVVVVGNNLKRGDTKSCGCLKKEALKERFVTHGESSTPEYYIHLGYFNTLSNAIIARRNGELKYWGKMCCV